jgi:hypothetical protein
MLKLEPVKEMGPQRKSVDNRKLDVIIDAPSVPHQQETFDNRNQLKQTINSLIQEVPIQRHSSVLEKRDIFTRDSNLFSPKSTEKPSVDPFSFLTPYIRKINDCSNRTLIIVPGYSITYPPTIGEHDQYISALKFDPETNPRGYKRIYIFNLYSKERKCCNFKITLSELAEQLWRKITEKNDDWEFTYNGKIDFIGASMGGLIVRKMIKDHLVGQNILKTKTWGALKINTIVLIATPNFGCAVIDRLYHPFYRRLIALLQKRDPFKGNRQLKQAAVGNKPVFKGIFSKIFKRRSPENHFLEELNNGDLTPGNIRWITIRGTKKRWFSKLVYDNDAYDDGVVEASKVPLPEAENICDKDLGKNISWDHRDLYENPQVADLLHGLMINSLTVQEYLQLHKTGKTIELILQDRRFKQQLLQRLEIPLKCSRF